MYHVMRLEPEYSEFLHDAGYGEPVGKHFKMFCFSQLRGKSYYRNKTLTFPSAVSFSIRTADPAQAAILQQALQLHQTYILNKHEVVL